MATEPKTVQMPAEYKGREQSWFKHRALNLYLESWAHKLGSVVRTGKVRLWYVDCFAGPWESSHASYNDTSIFIGLETLKGVAEHWKKIGYHIDVGAIFVEENPASFGRLQGYLSKRQDPFAVHPFLGEFGDNISNIEKLIGSDPAFLFVDPTGWNGAAMRYIKPLACKPRRDVMINVMYDYMNRFKGLPEESLKAQIKDFFECDVPAYATETELMNLYKQQLKSVCKLEFAADLIIQYPTSDRTYFRLVVGGHHEAVVRLFRTVEKKVVGHEARVVRAEAKQEKKELVSGQATLFPATIIHSDDVYGEKNVEGIRHLTDSLPNDLKKLGPTKFYDLRCKCLQDFHLTEADLKRLVLSLVKSGKIKIHGMTSKEKTVKDDHVLLSV